MSIFVFSRTFGQGVRAFHRPAAATLLLSFLLALSVRGAAAQDVSLHEPSALSCLELNQIAMAQAANGQFDAAETSLSAALAPRAGQDRDACAGVIFNNLAVFMTISGRFAEAERFAGQSIKILEKIYSADDAMLLRPLQTLAAVWFEQGKMAMAKGAFKRMQLIRPQGPVDSALFHEMAAALLDVEGRLPEAETEYLAALHALEEAGRGDMADAGGVLNGIGSVYIKEQRLDEARPALDRALAIFNRAKDAGPMDHIKLLNLRGVLHARRAEWQEAEEEFRDALSIADREPRIEPVVIRSLLTSYAYVLHKNHRRQEAHAIEARLAALHRDYAREYVVDVMELSPRPKRVRK